MQTPSDLNGKIVTGTNQKPVVLKPEIHNKRSILKRLNDSKYLLILFAPCLLYYLLFQYLPMFGIIISFKDYNLFQGVFASDWVGFHYYLTFFQSPDFFKLLRNTFLLGFYTLVFGFPAPIILALLLNEVRNMIYKRLVQTISYLPHFISNVVAASMVIVFLSPRGMINQFLSYFNIDPLNFLLVPEYFRTIYVSMEIWQTLGWGAIIYLAALSAIDPQLYEAAEIDGANRWRRLIHVTLPGIAPVIFILAILNIGRMVEIGFEKVYLLYNPVTYETADIINTYVYRIGLVQGNYSYATAIGVFMGVISLIFLYYANFLARKAGQTSLW